MQKSREWMYRVCLVLLPAMLAIFAGAAGVWALMDVPALGVSLSFSSGGVRVKDVDEHGPAAGLIVPGEYLRAIGDVVLEQDDLLRYPEYVLNSEEQAWWKRQGVLYDQLTRSNPVAVVIASADQEERTVWLKSFKWPWTSVLVRGLPIYISGLILVGMSILIYSYSQSTLHRVCQVIFVSIGLYHMVTAPMALREIVLNPLIGRGLTYAAYIGAGGGVLLAHFALIFPRKKKIVVEYPWLVWIPYIYYGGSVLLYLTRITAFGSTYLCLNYWALVVIVATLHGYFSEEDLLLKRQILLFLMIPLLLTIFFGVFIVIPEVMRTPIFEYSNFAIFTIPAMFSMALAVENQRLYLASLAKEHSNYRDRLQIIREMHDNFSNVLTGIVRLAGPKDPGRHGTAETARVLPQIEKAAQNCLTDVRSFIVAVDPASARWEEYAAHCQEQAAEYLEPLHVQLGFRSVHEEASDPIRPPVRYHLTGIVREALGNIVKHAKARRVEMSLEVHEKRGELRIEDDGTGFDVQAVSAGSYGLVHMAERAKELGGRLQIDSSDKGTRLVVDFIP